MPAPAPAGLAKVGEGTPRPMGVARPITPQSYPPSNRTINIARCHSGRLEKGYPMSNTNTMERLYGRCEQYAYAFARGKDAFADMAHDLFTTTALSDAIVADDEPRKLYTTVRNRAETIAAQSFKPLKEQSAKSATAQVSKLANFHTLGVYHRDGV